MLVDLLGLDEDDLESRPMGSSGEDIIMGKQSNKFPYSIECKNQETQYMVCLRPSNKNCKGYEPLVVLKRNRSKVLVLLDAEHFVKLHKD